MHQKPDFKTAFLALMEEESPGGHPSGEALAAYRGGELTAEEKASIDSHLAECRECTELAQDLDLFTEPARPAEEGDEFEVAAFLQRLKSRLTSENSTPRAEAKIPWFLPLAVAASMTLAVAASWWLSRSLTKREMLAELSRPRPNVEISDLFEDRSVRTGSPARTAKVPVNADVVLVLTPDRPGDFLAYEAKILDAGGALVATVKDLEKHPIDETFTLWIPPGYLALGDYRVELYGLSKKPAKVIASHQVLVVGTPEAPP